MPEAQAVLASGICHLRSATVSRPRLSADRSLQVMRRRWGTGDPPSPRIAAQETSDRTSFGMINFAPILDGRAVRKVRKTGVQETVGATHFLAPGSGRRYSTPRAS